MFNAESQRFHEVPHQGKLEFIISEKPINISVHNKWSKMEMYSQKYD